MFIDKSKPSIEEQRLHSHELFFTLKNLKRDLNMLKMLETKITSLNEKKDEVDEMKFSDGLTVEEEITTLQKMKLLTAKRLEDDYKCYLKREYAFLVRKKFSSNALDEIEDRVKNVFNSSIQMNSEETNISSRGD